MFAKVRILLLVVGLICTLPVAALSEQQKLLASDGETYDRFGHSVAIDGDTAVVGAVRGNGGGMDSGAAYVFTRDASGVWNEQYKIVAFDTTGGEEFGASVALDGDTMVIGAPRDNVWPSDEGAAYVFTRDASGAWIEQAKLVAADARGGAGLGIAVALDDDTAVLGASGDFVNGKVSAGSAYVFTRDANGVWTEQAKLIASDADWNDYFGASVAVDGNTAIIGAPHDDDNGNSSGSAYVFTRDATGAWSERTKLLPYDGANGDRAGYSVALAGDTALLDASFHSAGAPLGGAVYVFTRDTAGVWSEQAKLVPSDEEVGARFGFSVALDGDTSVIGSRLDSVDFIDDGSAYVFRRDSAGLWSEQDKLLASDGSRNHFLGHSVAVDDCTAIVGATGDDDNGDIAGAAYIFALPRIVSIDVKPDSFPNSVNPNAHGVIPVAILGGDSLDVGSIDVTTLRFGRNEARIAHNLDDSLAYNDHLRDVNLDGYVDLVTHFRTWQTGISCLDDTATLVGEMVSGQAFEGSDSIRTVGCRSRRGRGQERWRRLVEPE